MNKPESASPTSLKGIDQKLELQGQIMSLWTTADEYEREGNSDQAEKMYRQICELAPEEGEAFYCLGVIQQARGDLKEAVTSFQQMLKRNPDDAFALVILGSCYFRLGQNKTAESCFEKALYAPLKTQQERHDLGFFFMKFGQLQRAAICLNGIFERNE